MPPLAEQSVLRLQPLQRFERQMLAQLAGAPGPVNTFFKQAGARILSMQQRRYDILSAGGSWQGESWAPLAPSTQRGKRRRRTRRVTRRNASGQFARGKTFAVLKDTGIMRNALLAGAPGNVMERLYRPPGMRIGIGGGSHPSGRTIGQIAGYHHRGSGKLPRRTVVSNKFDTRTTSGIRGDLKRAVGRVGKGLA